MVGPARILLVDDSPAIIYQLTRLLESVAPESEVVAAHDLRTARAMLSLLPDVVFLDVRLSDGSSGLELIWDIGRTRRDVRIVTMSGLSTDHPLVTAAATVGAHAHVAKPLRRAAVREALGSGLKAKAK